MRTPRTFILSAFIVCCAAAPSAFAQWNVVSPKSNTVQTDLALVNTMTVWIESNRIHADTNCVVYKQDKALAKPDNHNYVGCKSCYEVKSRLEGATTTTPVSKTDGRKLKREQRTEERMQRTEERKQRAEERKQRVQDRAQRTEERKQRAEERMQRVQDRAQRTEERKQRAEERMQRTEERKHRSEAKKQQQ